MQLRGSKIIMFPEKQIRFFSLIFLSPQNYDKEDKSYGDEARTNVDVGIILLSDEDFRITQDSD